MNGEHCIIAFANHRGNYMLGMARLMESLTKNGYTGAFIGSVGEASIGAPNHLDNPYAFKIYCFEKALKMGYKKILYLDCSVAAVAPLDPVWEMLEKQPVVFQEAGAYLDRWINDNALKYFGISRDAIAGVVCHGNAGFLGINFETEQGRIFFDKWKASMQAGAFIGSWDDHRHDLSCGSMIAWLMGLQKYYIPGDQVLEYAIPGTPKKNDTIIFQAAGM